MRAWVVTEPGRSPVAALKEVERADPHAGPHEVRVKVRACGVCRTDLHLVQGDLAPHHPNTVPGHEIVGEVDEVGSGAERFSIGDRIGLPWLRHTDGTCRWCRRGAENLCPNAEFTGWDADGGYAEYAAIDEAFAYRLPDALDDAEAAPLLCAGIVGYRALRRTGLPPGGRLGIYGFGASAHLVAQVALHEGATVHVLTRSEADRQLARDLGVASVAGADDAPPEPLDAAVLFAPVGDLVPPALRALDRGGVLSLAGIHLSDIPALNYERELFYEKEVRSVTANTRADGEEFLRLAAAWNLTPTIHRRPLDEAATTLADLDAGSYDGAAVLIP